MNRPEIVALKQVRGVGNDRAERIFNAYGADLDRAFLSPEALEELAVVIAGKPYPTRFARRVAAELAAEWKHRLKPEFEAAAWLAKHGIQDARLTSQIVRLLGKDTSLALQQNPYVLSRALSWSVVDQVGLPLLSKRSEGMCALQAPQRLVGAVGSAMADLLQDGNTATDVMSLATRVSRKLRSTEAVARASIEQAVTKGHILRTGDLLRSPGCAWMEKLITKRFCSMARCETSAVKVDAKTVARHLDHWRTGQRPQPSSEQAASVQFALERQLSVITGGAGTGKTTSMLGVVEAWTAMGGSVQLCTLSGKAALRLSQTTRRRAKTIHRLLRELEMREKLETEGNQVPKDYAALDDKTLILIDEASMVDLGLFCRLVQRMPEGCRLLLCGDVAQLPPIGPGIVFHELAKIPEISSNLTIIFRQAEGSEIPAVARSIRDRQAPNFSDFDGPSESVDLIPCALDDINDRIVEVVSQLGGFREGSHELQILAALNARCDELNARFHAMRARIEDKECKGYLAQYYSPGDPVVFLANDYKRSLFNGLMGHVTSVDETRRSIATSFEGSAHFFALPETLNVSLAYCLSCHKLQGSQAERIVIAVEPTRLMEPSWLYTAITRARKQAVLVGDPDVIQDALRRLPSWKTRKHGLDLSNLLNAEGDAA
ncbi:AAA family ATPase [Sagittula sp.]|uniref:AAA family ATPase n=1 Tax=Sagittula sp. TaxID=2038081 RepID=UPI003518ED3D